MPTEEAHSFTKRRHINPFLSLLMPESQRQMFRGPLGTTNAQALDQNKLPAFCTEASVGVLVFAAERRAGHPLFALASFLGTLDLPKSKHCRDRAGQSREPQRCNWLSPERRVPSLNSSNAMPKSMCVSAHLRRQGDVTTSAFRRDGADEGVR